MFGYILPEKPELKIKEYELFRAFYCGVCSSIGKRHGQLPRLLLNYDSAFLAVLLCAMNNQNYHICRERCIAHPFSKRSIIKDNHIVDYASDMNILLSYYKLDDNVRDEGSALAATGKVFLKTAFVKLKEAYPEKCSIIEKRLKELNELEKSGCSSMDMAAEPFAKLMEEITACPKVCEEKETEKIIRWLGYNIGKWIYILDAYDDVEADEKKKSYNPLFFQFDYKGTGIAEFKSSIRERVEFNLTYSLNQIAKACELIEFKSNRGIIENIVYMGMLRKTENILNGSCKKGEKSV